MFCQYAHTLQNCRRAPWATSDARQYRSPKFQPTNFQSTSRSAGSWGSRQPLYSTRTWSIAGDSEPAWSSCPLAVFWLAVTVRRCALLIYIYFFLHTPKSFLLPPVPTFSKPPDLFSRTPAPSVEPTWGRRRNGVDGVGATSGRRGGTLRRRGGSIQSNPGRAVRTCTREPY